MADKEWKTQVLSFLKKAGDDIKKVGDDVKTETTRLMEELKDPAKQAAAREKLDHLGTWAKKTAEGAATMAEAAMKKVEDGLSTATDFVSETVVKGGKGGGGLRHDTPLDTPAVTEAKAPSSKPRKATKTVGRKAPGSGKKAAPSKPASKKTMGRKKG